MSVILLWYGWLLGSLLTNSKETSRNLIIFRSLYGLSAFFSPVNYQRKDATHSITVSNKSCVTFAMEDLAHILSCLPIFKPLRIKSKAPMKRWKSPISETDIQGQQTVVCTSLFSSLSAYLCVKFIQEDLPLTENFSVFLPSSLFLPPPSLSSLFLLSLSPSFSLSERRK